jgi:RNA polymerase sigma-70 factor, ECF subfamily
MGKVMGEVGEDPFEAVVEAHHAEIHRYLTRVTARATDADDLSQEVFLRAFRAHGALSPQANVRAWLFAIATNLCRNHFRAEGRRRRAYVAARADGADTDPGRPERLVEYGEAAARLDQVIAELPPKQRLAFTLRKIHELDYEAIGSSLRCSAESARAHVFQAMRKIRRALDGPAMDHTEPRHE